MLSKVTCLCKLRRNYRQLAAIIVKITLASRFLNSASQSGCRMLPIILRGEMVRHQCPCSRPTAMLSVTSHAEERVVWDYITAVTVSVTVTVSLTNR
ncbi:hypothetical protein J6590_057018 [Homalodisca vitripennis]|nr:hypothetical protein J6590_057018 [Homalodisca vitripennis]